MAPMKLTTSSGMDVPTPTIAAPMTKSDTLNFLAIETAPATRKSAPKTIPTSDIIKITYSIYYFISFSTASISYSYTFEQGRYVYGTYSNVCRYALPNDLL